MKIEKQGLKRSYDLEFLPQENTRIIRLMWELLEPQSKLQMENADRPIVFLDRLEFDPQRNRLLTRASTSEQPKEYQEDLKTIGHHLFISNLL